MSLQIPARPPEEQAEVYSKESRQSLAQLVTKLFDLWALSNGAQLDLLGMSGGSASTLARYRRGEPLAPNRDLIERVGHLLAIHKNLRLYFPHNPRLAYSWMSAQNRDFDGLSPIEVIHRFGFAGLLMVRGYLDRVRGE